MNAELQEKPGKEGAPCEGPPRGHRVFCAASASSPAVDTPEQRKLATAAEAQLDEGAVFSSGQEEGPQEAAAAAQEEGPPDREGGDSRRAKRQRENTPAAAAAAGEAATAAAAAGISKKLRRRKGALNGPPSRHSLMHPRSRFFGGPLNFRLLAESHPPLGAFLSVYPSGCVSFDFKPREAQLQLCVALFRCMYSISFSLPPQQEFLVPTLPNRSNYIHFLADLLSQTEGLGPPRAPPGGARSWSPYILGAPCSVDTPEEALPGEQKARREHQELGTPSAEAEGLPRGPQFRILDVGVGANCVYPLLGVADYDWFFVGCDISADSLSAAAANIKANGLEDRIELRRQLDCSRVFAEVVQEDDPLFAACVCNPPFYSSEDAIGFNPRREKGGSFLSELVCEGGEEAFLSRMFQESKAFCHRFLWFTSLVARASTRDELKKQIHDGMRRVGRPQEAAMQRKAQQWALKFNFEELEDGSREEGSLPIETQQVEMHPRELRLFELSQGKQTRWVVCWTYWNKQQRKLLRQIFGLGTW